MMQKNKVISYSQTFNSCATELHRLVSCTSNRYFTNDLQSWKQFQESEEKRQIENPKRVSIKRTLRTINLEWRIDLYAMS